MKLLFTGRGKAGSWLIRGEQLGAACGARVVPMASTAECKTADVIVAVKRVPDELLRSIRVSGRPWAYDIVDAYPQPRCAEWGRAEAVRWLTKHIRALAPDMVIWPNDRMREDAGIDGPVIPHHCRPGIERNPIRDRIAVIGYEGGESYIGPWRAILEDEARSIGARFIVNARALADLDVVVALRGGDADCYAARKWKSGVKLANAHGSGTPFVGQPDPGYTETAIGGERWATDRASLRAALEELAPMAVRAEVSARFVNERRTVEQVSAELKRSLRVLYED